MYAFILYLFLLKLFVFACMLFSRFSFTSTHVFGIGSIARSRKFMAEDHGKTSTQWSNPSASDLTMINNHEFLSKGLGSG